MPNQARLSLSRLFAACAVVAVLTAGTAVAQQMPSENGTNASGAITILKNMSPEPAGTIVKINGRQVDHLSVAGYDDITTAVHPGRNTLTIVWSGPIQRLNFKIAYAPTHNNFKNVIVVQADATHDAALRRSGMRTLVFMIPR